MKIQHYLDKLDKSDEYREFSKKHSKAFMTAGFFVLDLEMGKNMHQLDFYVPKTNKVAAFTLDEGIKMQMLDLLGEKVPEKLSNDINIDLDSLYGILEDEMKNRNITEDIKKIVAILQCVDGKTIWNINCILSGMELLKAHVDDESRTVLKMEKLSMFDLVKKMPGKAFQQALKAKAMQQQGKGEGDKEEAKEELKKINELESKLEQEKALIEKQLSKEKTFKKVKDKKN